MVVDPTVVGVPLTVETTAAVEIAELDPDPDPAPAPVPVAVAVAVPDATTVVATPVTAMPEQ
jgi:hypothetical protein